MKEEKNLIDAVAKQLSKIIERKKIEIQLKRSKAELTEQKLSLERKNVALKELIGQIEIEKKNIEENVIANVNESILPILRKIRRVSGNRRYIELLEYHLRDMTSSFAKKMKQMVKLSPREIEICNLIKGNLTSKEISRLLFVSPQTVEKHRKNIRKKLKLSHKKVNLTSFIQQL